MSSVMLHPQTNVAGAWYASQAAEASKLVFTGKGMLHTLHVSNSNAAARFLYVFDNTTAAGTVVAGPHLIPPTSSIVVHMPFGVPFSTGLMVAGSTSQDTFTAGGAELRMLVGYAKRT